MKSAVEAMSGIYAQLIGQDVGVLPLVEACNKILDYVLENGFGGGSSNPLTPAQLEKIKKDVIDKIKTQVPMGVLLKDCELVDSKLKYTLSDNSNKELDLATLINKSVKNYVDIHKSELKGDRGLKGEQGVAGVNGKSAYDIWKEKGNTGTEQDFLNSLKGQNGTQGQKGEKGNTGESAFETWKRVKSKPTANETEFLDSLKGAKGDTGSKGSDGVQGQKGNDGIGITNIEKVGDKLKITLSNGQIKEFTIQSGGSGTTGLTEEQVKTLINTLYKPQIDSKLERGGLDKNITADQLKKSIDKNTDKLTQTITDLKLVGDKLKYKENGIEKSIILPSGSGGLTTSQVKQIIDTDYVPTINSKLEKGHYTGNATDLEKSINNKADKIELQNYAKKTDISEFIKGTDADTKYNTKKEFDKLKNIATTKLSLEGKNLKFKENGVEKTITLPASSEGSGLNEAQVKAIVDRDYKPSIDNKIDKSEYQAKIAVLETTVSSKQDASTALKMTDVKNEIKKVVGTAPEALDTLQEIAQALGNDPNKINTILTQLGLKVEKSEFDTLKEKVITDIRFVNNIITYNENNIDKNIDLNSYVNLSTADIESIVENKGNTLYESKYRVKTLIDRLTQNVNKSFSGFAGGIYNFSYIQDDIEKLEGQYYLDRNTGSLVKCIKTTTSIINSAEYYKDYSLDSIIKNLESLTEIGSNEKGSWFKDKRTGLIIQWGFINITVTKQDYEEHFVVLPIPFPNNSYSTSVARNYNYHNISDGKWSCTPRNKNEIRILTSGFTNSFGKIDKYFWIAIGV